MAKIKLEILESKKLDEISISDIKESIATKGGCLIRTRAKTSDSELSIFSSNFGKIIIHPKSNSDGIVKIKSGSNKTYLSQSNKNHPFHTDGTYLAESQSIDIIALQCVQPCPGGGGLNQIISGIDILNHLHKTNQQEIIKILSENSVLFSRGEQTSSRKIFRKEKEKWKISFRSDSAGDIRFPSKEVEAAYSILARIIQNEIAYMEIGLRENEILILDNTSNLHSRTDYSPNSNRLMNRIQMTESAINTGFKYE